MASLDFLSCSALGDMTVQLPCMLCACATFGGLQLRVIREIQPRVPASLHSLEHFFTVSHTLPLHDSHLNTGFLSDVLQANMSRNKGNIWLIKFNLTVIDSQPTPMSWEPKFLVSCFLKAYLIDL